MVGEQDDTDQIQALESLVDEVKGLYNLKFPFDDVDATTCEVERDADGSVWEISGCSVVDHVEALLGDVKSAYNERHPGDIIGDEDDTDDSKVKELFNLLNEVKGLYSVKYTPSNVEELEDLLEEVKTMYDDKYPGDRLFESLEEVKALYNSKYPSEQSFDSEECTRLDDLLQEVKDLYNSQHPSDQLDVLDSDLENDTVCFVKTIRENDHNRMNELEL